MERALRRPHGKTRLPTLRAQVSFRGSERRTDGRYAGTQWIDSAANHSHLPIHPDPTKHGQPINVSAGSRGRPGESPCARKLPLPHPLIGLSIHHPYTQGTLPSTHDGSALACAQPVAHEPNAPSDGRIRPDLLRYVLSFNQYLARCAHPLTSLLGPLLADGPIGATLGQARLPSVAVPVARR